MTLHHLTGNVEVALSHLALCGLVSIADESTGTASRLWWTADQTPVPTGRRPWTPLSWPRPSTPTRSGPPIRPRG